MIDCLRVPPSGIYWPNGVNDLLIDAPRVQQGKLESRLISRVDSERLSCKTGIFTRDYTLRVQRSNEFFMGKRTERKLTGELWRMVMSGAFEDDFLR